MEPCSSLALPTTPFRRPRALVHNTMASQSPFPHHLLSQQNSSLGHTSDRGLLSSDTGPANGPAFRPASTVIRPPRRSSLSARVFAPLTPIIASPLSTPAPSISTQAASVGSDTEEERNSRASTQQNVAHSSPVASAPSIPTPTWTSTPPTPPANVIYRTKHAPSRSVSSTVTVSTSLPDGLLTDAGTPAFPHPKERRASLPPIATSKPLPSIPVPATPSSSTMVPPASSGPHVQCGPHRADEIASHSELSTHGRDHLLHPKASQTRPVFHLALDGSDREEDGQAENGLVRSDSSDPDSAVVALIPSLPLLENQAPTREKEHLRRYHALLELLSTEAGYLLDLQILVSVYLRLLPILRNRPSSPSSSNLSISHFSRSPSTPGLSPFNATLRAQSYPHLCGSSQQLPAPLWTEIYGSAPPTAYALPVKEREKSSVRHLFSTEDLDAITRNAEDILNFHEKLVDELRTAVSPFGISMSSEGISDEGNAAQQRSPEDAVSSDDVRRAVNAVSIIFINHASCFDCYQTFCSGHPEAFELVRKVQQTFSAEWDAFEHRCTAIATEMRSDASTRLGQGRMSSEHVDSSVLGEVLAARKKRRHSLSSLDASARPQGLPHVFSSVNLKASNLSASECGHSDKYISTSRPRLLFMDYLIKPIQRICKYPLLLEQLQEATNGLRYDSSNSHASSSTSSAVEHSPRDTSHGAVRGALLSMRAVASSVDEARRQQEISVKSALIMSRISQGLVSSAGSHSRPPHQSLTSAFLSSLGPCRLAGSLDVIHYHGSNFARSGTVKAKYLGAFLFPGGFLVLVKVAKTKSYEAKHWFSLKGFELVDASTDNELLPSWFRLSSKGHTFELAASCQREKGVWMDAIRAALAEDSPWNEEPATSIQADTRGDHTLEDAPFEMISPLPTIQSIPEIDAETALQNVGEPSPTPTQSNVLKPLRSHGRSEYTARSDHPLPTIGGANRRSSLASSWAYQPSASESTTFHLVRSTASAREQVDRGLLDVFSEKCLTARLRAHTREEDLFEAQNVTRSFSRSSSGLTMASAMSVAAMNRLTKRESVLVPRRKSLVEGNGTNEFEGHVPVYYPMARPGGKRRQPKKLKIVALAKTTSSDGDDDLNEVFIESPSPMSHCSSASVTTPATPLTASAPLSAPVSASESMPPRSEFLAVRQGEGVPKRSRSMIENVRGLFTPRTTTPVGLAREPSSRSSVSSPSLLKWWSRETLRRRVRSAPDVPADEIPPALTSQSLNETETLRPTVTLSDRPRSQPDIKGLERFPLSAGREPGGEYPTPRVGKRLFSRRRSTASMTMPGPRDEAPKSGSVRTRHNLSFLQRFSPMSPSAVVQSSGS
ncbi:hypothetical protein F5I97DRAFT_859415 [Phlebopus sp. FC_14]|nr:hypothetical protein F5I97DRAFT_859415 [Phlebopus sp. FC_14]